MKCYIFLGSLYKIEKGVVYLKKLFAFSLSA